MIQRFDAMFIVQNHLFLFENPLKFIEIHLKTIQIHFDKCFKNRLNSLFPIEQ